MSPIEVSAAPRTDQADRDTHRAADGARGDLPLRVVLVGNPNTGKTTLFNRLCGVRHKTSNFPGTTQEARRGTLPGADRAIHLVDLPGAYSLELHGSESTVVRRVLAGDLAPPGEPLAAPDAVCVVLDATNLPRGLMVLGEALRRRLPTVVAINLVDAARRRGIRGDERRLEEILGCPVVVCSARTGEGLEALRGALGRARIPVAGPRAGQEALEHWADELASEIFSGRAADPGATLTDHADRAFTHPVLGLILFAAVMTGLFWAIFRLATYPMDWIEAGFGWAGERVAGVLGDGVLSDLLVGGVLSGVGATLVFLPQICLLFFIIALLEDTGYLARAAFVMDRLMRPFGLSGHAFVPLLSSHACALPGIMAARAIPDRRDRLATILVAPFMSCSARIPVYVLLVGLLFPGRPGVQALAFTGCYVLGACAGLVSALVARRTILRGPSRPMVMELPTYRRPSTRTAALTALDRGMIFLRKAGTVILAISIVLWWLSTYPRSGPTPEAEALRAQAAALDPGPVDAPGTPTDEPATPGDLLAEADAIDAAHGARRTFIARLGSAVEPVFAPLGYDRQLSVGVLASFAAREVFVSTMSVMVTGEEGDAAEGTRAALAKAKRDDGSPLFTWAVSWSLLVYYVLAMQCLPTLAVTAREAGGAKWAFIQLGWMSLLAYVGAFAVFQVAG
ncbi:MAG: ferrous iron transporter B [Phycisphaerales bacterium]|nr:ferrous iron transporter B [Phycisphaerales bacterium]